MTSVNLNSSDRGLAHINKIFENKTDWAVREAVKLANTFSEDSRDIALAFIFGRVLSSANAAPKVGSLVNIVSRWVVKSINPEFKDFENPETIVDMMSDELTKVFFLMQMTKIEKAIAIASRILDQSTREIAFQLISGNSFNKIGETVVKKALDKKVSDAEDFQRLIIKPID